MFKRKGRPKSSVLDDELAQEEAYRKQLQALRVDDTRNVVPESGPALVARPSARNRAPIPVPGGAPAPSRGSSRHGQSTRMSTSSPASASAGPPLPSRGYSTRSRLGSAGAMDRGRSMSGGGQDMRRPVINARSSNGGSMGRQPMPIPGAARPAYATQEGLYGENGEVDLARDVQTWSTSPRERPASTFFDNPHTIGLGQSPPPRGASTGGAMHGNAASVAGSFERDDGFAGFSSDSSDDDDREDINDLQAPTLPRGGGFGSTRDKMRQDDGGGVAMVPIGRPQPNMAAYPAPGSDYKEVRPVKPPQTPVAATALSHDDREKENIRKWLKVAMERADAQNCLNESGMMHGTYLVRKSSGGTYGLSIVAGGNIFHMKILTEPNADLELQWHVQGDKSPERTFKSIWELLLHYKQRTERLKWHLTHCISWKFIPPALQDGI